MTQTPLRPDLTLPAGLGPSIIERLNRARADLRMGVPVVLTGDGSAVLAVAAEALDAVRLERMRQMGGALVLAITSRRAETLKARAYDGDLARVLVPGDATLGWVQAVADPADDLNSPMKGPFISQRDGTPDLHRAAIALAKSARLLPAALVLPVANPHLLQAEHALTLIDMGSAAAVLDLASPLHSVASARLPMAVSAAGRLHVFRPEDGGEEHYAIEIGRASCRERV